jgi:uncharacterized cupin superfamily protein
MTGATCVTTTTPKTPTRPATDALLAQRKLDAQPQGKGRCIMMINCEIVDNDWNRIDFAEGDIGYVELAPWPVEMRVSGSLRQWQRIAFTGEELIGVFWRSESGTIKIDHYPFDQTVVVLRGNLKLIKDGGKEQRFAPGSTFLLPRGFKGLWIMEDGGYEELIVVERSTFQRHQ